MKWAVKKQNFTITVGREASLLNFKLFVFTHAFTRIFITGFLTQGGPFEMRRSPGLFWNACATTENQSLERVISTNKLSKYRCFKEVYKDLEDFERDPEAK